MKIISLLAEQQVFLLETIELTILLGFFSFGFSLSLGFKSDEGGNSAGFPFVADRILQSFD